MRFCLSFLFVLTVSMGHSVSGFPFVVIWRSSSSPLVLKAESSRHDESNETTPSKRPRGRVRPIRRGVQLSSQAKLLQEKQKELEVRKKIAQQDPNLLVDTQFEEVVSPQTARALKENIGVDRMTVVQGRTFALARSGKSMLVQAATGSGKTLAFLVPLVEELLTMDPGRFQPSRQIGVLVIVPTRELAMQIVTTARDLVVFHPMLSVKAVVGGTSIQRDVRAMEKNLPSLLIATPGRLLDLVQEERIRGRKFGDILKETSVVVLDEADLLVMGGFAKDLLKIFTYLPRARQTLMFSATIPSRLRKALPEFCMTKELVQIDCINKNQETPLCIEESFFQLEKIEMYVPGLLSLIRKYVSRNSPGHKVIIFLPAVRIVQFFAIMVQSCMGEVPVWQIHAQLSQSARNKASESFRSATSGVLLTSDISSRGVHYPNVDTVIQYGLPNRRELYLHRIGRTGRAGQTGEAVLVLMPFESAGSLRRKNLKRRDESRSLINGLDPEKRKLDEIVIKIKENKQPFKEYAETFVLAFLAYYAAHKPDAVDPAEIRTAGLHIAREIGLDDLPEMSNSLSTALE